jgi:hypothetical protein
LEGATAARRPRYDQQAFATERIGEQNFEMRALFDLTGHAVLAKEIESIKNENWVPHCFHSLP